MGCTYEQAQAGSTTEGGGVVSDSTTALVQVPQITGLSLSHQRIVDDLVGKLARKASRNRLRRRYYDYKNLLRDLGISIPPSLRNVETVVGWPAKAVDSMSRRTVLQGFLLGDGASSTADLGLDELWDLNRMESVVPQAHTSALIHSTAFGFVTAGDTGAGEPPVLLSVRSAEWATGTWDSRLRTLKNALSVVSVDERGAVDELVIYEPNRAVIARREGQSWDLRQVDHDLGVPVEVLPYRPLLDRPFGSSRISRPVMALTDSAVRTLLRTEVSAEFFNAPQRYAMGADEDAFDGQTGWEVLLGRMLTLSRDEDGNLPSVGQFQQQSMEPNIAQFRMLAQAFASETSLPLRSLGVVGDNPESSDAIIEANKELELEIRHWEDSSLSPAWRRLAVHALRVLDDSPAARAQYATLRPRWADPTTVSVIAAADALVKKAAVIPRLGETTVGQEMAGMSVEQIARYQAEVRRLDARQTTAALIAAARQPADPAAAPDAVAG